MDRMKSTKLVQLKLFWGLSLPPNDVQAERDGCGCFQCPIFPSTSCFMHLSVQVFPPVMIGRSFRT